MEDNLVSIQEIAEYFSVSVKTIRNWVKDDKIPYVKIGRTYRFSMEEIKKEGKNVPAV